MIQKYTCVPATEYDVLIVTNGTVTQVERALHQLNEKIDNEVPLNSNIVYLDSFNDLITYLNMTEEVDAYSRLVSFKGKTVFMFFNGVEYIQTFLSEIIDHYNSVLLNASQNFSKFKCEKLYNSYFYFDSTIATDLQLATSQCAYNRAHQFNTLVCIANDILKKMNFMLCRIRGVFLDDTQLQGETTHSVHGLLRNFPNLERIEHSRDAPLINRHLMV